jgi:hypothetical protein
MTVRRRMVKTTEAHTAMLDGELVMLHPDSGCFFTLADTGLAIWQMLDAETELNRIVEGLVGEYEVDAETCRVEVGRFAHQLARAGFVELS